MKEIILYTTVEGKCPFIEWISNLDSYYRVRINKRLNRIKDGNFGDWKHLKDSKLSEIRMDFGKGYRIYYKELDDIIILILAGSNKSNQKATIKLADQYYEDFITRRTQNDYKI